MPHYIVKDGSPIAKSNPKMIKMARINRGLSDEDIKYFYENYKLWENGEKPTTWSDLRLIAKFYGKPSFYYFLNEEFKDGEEGYLKDFTMRELLDELEYEFDEFKSELFERLSLIEDNVTFNDL